MSDNSSFNRPSAVHIAAMQEYWHFCEPRRALMAERTRAAAALSPAWSSILTPSSAEQVGRGGEEAHTLQVRAILDGRWEPYLASLRAQGERYAEAGISYSAWFELIRAYRDSVSEQLSALLKEEPQRSIESVLTIKRGMNCLVNIAIEQIGEAYLSAKQRMVAQSEELHRSMFENSPLPMWTFDPESLRFATVNEAAVRHYGYTREEFATMTIADIRPPEDVAALHADVNSATGIIDNGTRWRHRKKDGTLITVEVRANDFLIGGRRVRLVLINDVTERARAEQALRKTEEQLRHSQKMEAIGRLAGSVAHDFNNVLTVIQSYACMLEDGLPDQHRDDATEIRRAAERASGITRQLLTLSRHSTVAARPVSLAVIVDGLVPILQRLVGETVTILTLRSEVPDVIADPGQIEQVLMNLAVNARDAMPNGGQLTFELRVVEVDQEAANMQQLQPGRYVELAVTDTGQGIDRETQTRIFEPFFTTKEVGKGTGLGLSIVHGIVTQAGGGITVYSEPGYGTTFRVRLPVATNTFAVAEPERIVAPRTLPPLRVLIIDDHADVRGVAARILRDAGCQVLEATTADEARRLCVSQDDSIDVALIDVVLPDMRGDLLAGELRELRPTMAFVLMSGYPIGALSAAGATPQNMLPKPFVPSELRAAVARTCSMIDGSPSHTAHAASRAQYRALVVDDDPAFRGAVVRLLGRSGFEVVDVDSGYKAIGALESEPFDVLVSDVQMPDGGGLDLLRAVRRIDLDVPVILVTGDPSVPAAAAAVEYGAFRYLTKPVDNAALANAAKHAARAHALARLRREAFSVSGVHAGVADRAGLEVRFEQALEGLWMAFQPIVFASTGALFGVEALMRTSEPSLPNPGALLEAGSLLGRLPSIGRKVRALSGAAVAPRTDEIALFVNLHPEDLFDIDLIDETSPLTQIASKVVLEVTERTSLEPSSRLTERIARVRQLGFRLAVDDIGAGYSGLTSFTELAPEIVKIDMSIVRDVHQSALKQRTIAALCRLCHESGTLVVGEGVETNDERAALVDLGCDLLQGYLLGRPQRELP